MAKKKADFSLEKKKGLHGWFSVTTARVGLTVRQGDHAVVPRLAKVLILLAVQLNQCVQLKVFVLRNPVKEYPGNEN